MDCQCRKGMGGLQDCVVDGGPLDQTVAGGRREGQCTRQTEKKVIHDPHQAGDYSPVLLVEPEQEPSVAVEPELNS